MAALHPSCWFVTRPDKPSFYVLRMSHSNLRMIVLTCFVGVVGYGCQAAPDGATTAKQVVQCTVVHGWPQLPDGEALGQVTGVGINGDGAVYVFHRAWRIWSDPFPSEPIDQTTVWVFDGRTGQLLDRWGANFFIMAHGLTVDPENNVWVTDVGTHQVHKFTPDGRLLMSLGERAYLAPRPLASISRPMLQSGMMASSM